MSVFSCAHSQTIYWWAWMSGESGTFPYTSPINYGTMGVQAATNNPGVRDSQGGWTDASGNFWFYGGENIITGDYYDDLWKFRPDSAKWTWVGGSNLPNQAAVYGSAPGTSGGNPGSRYGHSFSKDPSGHFWFFGGFGAGNGEAGYFMNDLWTYDPSTGQWTWVSGEQGLNDLEPGVYGTQGASAANNMPGGRAYASIWFDASGNLWLFGGQGWDGESDLDALNDLWEYTGGQWIWIGGSNQGSSPGSYGTQGVTDANNMPPARYNQTTCVDTAGNLWMFGGEDGAENAYNDLWKFEPKKKLWTWVSGSNAVNQKSTYGTRGIPKATNMPGGRFGHTMQIDQSDNILIFGGTYWPPSYTGEQQQNLNELWSYNIQQQTWTWVSGSQTTNSFGSFGQKGVPASANLPPARINASSSLDSSGNLWIFGGWIATQLFYEGLDDVWEFAPVTPLPLESVSLQGLAQGNNNLLTWQTIDEINTSTFIIEKSTNGTGFTDIGSVTAVGSGNNSYSFADTHLAVSTGYFYRIEMKDRDGSTNYSQTIFLQSVAGSGLAVYPNPATSFVLVQMNDNSLQNTPLRLLDLDGRLITEQVITTQQQRIDLSSLSHGIYLLQFANGSTVKVLKE